MIKRWLGKKSKIIKKKFEFMIKKKMLQNEGEQESSNNYQFI